jgi:ligand-binding SRPBCC domain-containing protein
MQEIRLTTAICAPRERVFDLARSIDAHRASATGTDERAISGVTTGLIGLNDEVTWEARHFGLRLRLTVKVTEFDRPNHFRDVMVSGNFQKMAHDHLFAADAVGTLMTDCFVFNSPFGALGRSLDALFLARYLRTFLIHRNKALKDLAESKEWQHYLCASP